MASSQGLPASRSIPGVDLEDGDAVTLSNNNATQITGTATAIKSLLVRAQTGNTDDVLVGASTVSQGTPTRGYELGAGEAITIEIDDLSKVYFMRATSGSSPVFSWLALT